MGNIFTLWSVEDTRQDDRMTMKHEVAPSVDAYISQFPAGTQAMLEELRAAIRQVAPDSEECISYQMPAYKYHGALVYFAGYKGHVGFYPTGSGIEAFQGRFGPYKWSKGAVQFPLDQPLPMDLIREIVAYRLAENEAKRKDRRNR